MSINSDFRVIKNQSHHPKEFPGSSNSLQMVPPMGSFLVSVPEDIRVLPVL